MNTVARTPQVSSIPWYRHRWPWILMAGPVAVVLASMVTIYLAIKTDDGLVTDEYYRKGLAINQTLKLSERARELGLRAVLSFTVDGIRIGLGAAVPGFAMPQRLRVIVSHPTRAGFDQTQVLALEGGYYGGRFKLPASGHWVVLLEDEAKTWRIVGNILLPAGGEIVFGESGSEGR